MTSPPADPERRQVAAWVVALFAVAFHIWGLYTPSVPDAGALAFPGLDKLAHVVRPIRWRHCQPRICRVG